jgi:hypothetical protein
MRVKQEPLYDKQQTIERIFTLSKQFENDLESALVENDGALIPLSSLSLSQYFDLVKNIPYQQDQEPIEIVARPSIILSSKKKDCKKAAILLGAFLNKKNIPWRLVTISTRKDKKIHHIFPQAFLNGDYINLDATYSSMVPGQTKKATKVQYFEPGPFNALR